MCYAYTPTWTAITSSYRQMQSSHMMVYALQHIRVVDTLLSDVLSTGGQDDIHRLDLTHTQHNISKWHQTMPVTVLKCHFQSGVVLLAVQVPLTWQRTSCQALWTVVETTCMTMKYNCTVCFNYIKHCIRVCGDVILHYSMSVLWTISCCLYNRIIDVLLLACHVVNVMAGNTAASITPVQWAIQYSTKPGI